MDSLKATVPSGLADICIVNHNSTDPEAIALLNELRQQHTVIDYSGAFNYSVMNNLAIQSLQSTYSHYLFLNNDTEAIQPGWLQRLIGTLENGEAAVAGPALLYDDGRIQHAGVVVGLGFVADHVQQFRPYRPMTDSPGLHPEAIYARTRECSAVTGACLLMKSEVFHQVGGFDESFVVGFGDIDLCLKARNAGHRVLYDGDVALTHYESATRGNAKLDSHPLDTLRFMRRYKSLLTSGDPFYSPLLDPIYSDCRPAPGCRSIHYRGPRTVTMPHMRATNGTRSLSDAA
jgi:GT2 family glycosyltransferase